jgi:DivIVA domain-containing protein
MSDLQLAPTPSADQIRRREFATIRRGYDPDQVRDFLVAVGDSVEHLEVDLRDARTAASGAARPRLVPQPAPAGDPYEDLGKRFAGLLGTADKEAKRLVSDAKAESARILAEARAEADRIRVNAQARAEEARAESMAALEKSKREAQRTLEGLGTRRDTLLDQLQTMQTRLVSAADDLAAVIEKPEKAAPAAPAPAETSASGAKDREAVVAADPRYEDLWVSSDEDMGVAELSALELDFEDEDTPDER